MGRQRRNPQPVSDSKRRVLRQFAHASLRRALRPALVAVTLACSSVALTAQQPGADGPSKALEGRWRVELYLDKPSARTEPMAGQINGDIAFSNTAWWNPSDRFGRHDINLQSFFGNSFLKPSNITSFGPGDTSMVTEVSGYVRGDSVGIDFIPRVDHGGLSLWGRFWGDSAKGRWYRRGNDGEGHFVLRRVSREPVAVAAIPDGRAAVVAAAAPPPKPLTKAQARALARKEALAKAKAHADSLTLARAQAREKAKADALAKAAARDSAKAIAVAQAKAQSAARDSARAQRLADAKAKRDSAARVTVAARSSAASSPTVVAAAPAATASSPTAVVGAPAASVAPAAPVASTRLAAGSSRALPNALASPPAPSYASTTRDGAASTPVRIASTGAAPPAATTSTAPTSAAPASAAPTSSAASSPAGSAPLRVRIFDEASQKYFVTTYSLHLPDGHWMYGQLRTGNGPDGFGPAVNRPPGKYEIEITNFMCGDKLWFFKDRILKPVVIEPGAPADVTISVNLPAAPARPSLENKTGASCSAPPASQG